MSRRSSAVLTRSQVQSLLYLIYRFGRNSVHNIHMSSRFVGVKLSYSRVYYRNNKNNGPVLGQKLTKIQHIQKA